MTTIYCIHCCKECKTSDSRPFPNSKSTERIHNRCHLKKSLSDKQRTIHDSRKSTSQNSLASDKHALVQSTSTTILEKHILEEQKLKKETEERKSLKILESLGQDVGKTSNQFFFDMKAGVLKPHEKKRFLHHRSLCEIAPRYDDHGFKEDVVDRVGQDLDIFGDDDNLDDEFRERESKILKRPHHEEDEDVISNSTQLRKKNTNYAKIKPKRTISILVDDKNPCWFCLSSPNVEKHLIVAIKDHCYLTLAKGGLNDYHLLLLPIEHIQSLVSDANSIDLLNELEEFKKSIVKYFTSKSMGVVFFERNFRSVHWQLQVVPIPIDKIAGLYKKIKSISKNHFEKSDYIDIPDKCTLHDIIPPNDPYFFWQIEPIRQRFACQIQVCKGSFFPIQFGRLVLADASILDCEQRIDWKSCIKSEEEYTKLVKSIKDELEPFDNSSDD